MGMGVATAAANTSAAANILAVRRMFVGCAAMQNQPTLGKQKLLTSALAAILLTLTDHMVARCAPPLQWAGRAPGANGVILIGAVAGTEDGAGGQDQYFGPTSSVISWPSRFGLTATTPRSGATAIHSSGMPFSGPVPITRMDQPITMFTADMLTDEPALCAGEGRKLPSRCQTHLSWGRAAAASRQV